MVLSTYLTVKFSKAQKIVLSIYSHFTELTNIQHLATVSPQRLTKDSSNFEELKNETFGQIARARKSVKLKWKPT